ncbi:hypothetical protein HS088_TW11G00784 [Tripterygium wilfordii]|uniref:Uncharacterized protein n=1 Tax=Tripterygium wilfordii TaxID=458696 RepID=A0A7J7D2Y7_TRIWF|nr:uncharacterized protein LOC120009894 [Tripterygium wilfordii]KAF5740707.1 hypothetical protein HS088_TW11G00784 [Tripterygium wilfordii]
MLKMEVVIPARAMDFDFNSARSSPCSSIPSTPKRFGNYSSLSAPTSPTRISEFYREFENFLINDPISGGVPFDWEEMPGTPKSPKKNVVAAADDDFAFDFSQDLEKTSLSAEELFEGGVIRPLKPPPRLQLENRVYDSSKIPLLSPRSPRSPKEIIRNVFSPRRKKVSDPFAAAAEMTRKQAENERGRDRVATSPKNSSRRGARSLSPYRVSQFPLEEEERQQPRQQQQAVTKQSQVNSKSIITPSSSKSSSRRWRLKDFLLFRSASEGRASDRDPLRKYSGLSRKQEDVKTSSFRTTDGSGSGSGSRRRGPVSAHELHYTKNKAATEDLKRRTFLPYKTGILGALFS